MSSFIVKGNTNRIERLKRHFWEEVHHCSKKKHGPSVSNAVCVCWCYCLTMGHFFFNPKKPYFYPSYEWNLFMSNFFFLLNVHVPKYNRSFFSSYPAWSLMIVCSFLKVLTMDSYVTTFFCLSSYLSSCSLY